MARIGRSPQLTENLPGINSSAPMSTPRHATSPRDSGPASRALRRLSSKLLAPNGYGPNHPLGHPLDHALGRALKSTGHLPLLGRVVLNNGHIHCRPGAQNTGGLDATNAQREPCAPTFKFAEEL